MTTRIRIRIGATELEYETDAAVSMEQVLGLLTSVSKLPTSGEPETREPVEERTDGKILDLSMSTIAERLSVDSASSLTLAAAAYLDFVNGKTTFSRKEITAAMREAKNHCNDNHIKNLTGSLRGLQKADKLIENSSGVFAIQASARKDLLARLGRR